MVASGFGFSLDVHPQSYLAQVLHVYEPLESRLVQSLVRPGDFCIDAGAHVGYYSRLMCEAGGIVLAIEPNPKHIEMLRANLGGVFDATVFDYALSDKCQSSVPFYLPSIYDDGWGSLAASDIGTTEKINIETIRLDVLLDQSIHHPQRVRLLKMDIEGAEVPALRGLGNRLKDVDYILIECMDIESRTGVLHSTTEGINELLAGWAVRQACPDGSDLPKALNGGNYLFVNPNV
jgi:FkbM family methyltransferase